MVPNTHFANIDPSFANVSFRVRRVFELHRAQRNNLDYNLLMAWWQRADSHKSTLLRISLARSSRRTKRYLGKFANILAAYLQIRSLKLCSYNRYHLETCPWALEPMPCTENSLELDLVPKSNGSLLLTSHSMTPVTYTRCYKRC